MDINLRKFQNSKLIDAAIDLFEQLGVKIINISQSPRKLEDVIKENSLNKQSYSFVKNVYKLGGTESTFQTNNKINITIEQSDKNDHHIVIYALELERENNLLPSRTHIAEISRLFNREFARGAYILLLFKYSDGENEYISLSHTERNQGVRDPERDIPGKVTILRDINIENPHRGHLDILELMRVPEDAKTFKDIYAHWQKAFDVNTLNKKFYKELLHWYFWAVRESKFPNSSILEEQNQPELAKVEKAKHIIRMITRLLFAWFIKEKHLVPEELFDTDKLSERLKVFDANKGDNYYKAILQNLFFATLNCPINPTDGDERRRCFAESEEDNALNYKMRYDDFFKDHNAFLEMMNAKVPFLNGGLFECLDQKDNKDELKKYVDSFTNHTTALCVPNKLFFGSKVKIDFRQEYGVNASREEDVQGIIPLLKKYKFTVAENTPIEEDVALDPELLGKVFENLLAQYNPETKDSARKESGSFYTPREVVNYMVDESLIAYLKNKLEWPVEEEEKLRKLFDNGDANPYSGEPEKARAIIQAISNCKILDPACGSGAFPMGAMLRMVHVLGKLDPENEKWKAVQIQNATEQFQAAMTQEKKPEDREKRLEEIRKTFENNLLHADYIRKLFLIENCIFGVDIQDIAIQISKLRFFISLVIDQKSNNNAQDNFGILPLPNLETKLVAANTLIGVKEPEGQMDMFKNDADLIQYKKELTEVRSKFFRAHSSEEKENLRKEEGDILKNIETKLKPAWEEAKKKEEAEAKKKGRKKKVQVFDYTAELSKVFGWSPLRQNQNPATFFDPMTMFGLETFDVVMGNPPYVQLQKMSEENKTSLKAQNFETYAATGDIYMLFYERGTKLLSQKGILSFITSNKWMRADYGNKLRNYFKTTVKPIMLIDLGGGVFETATVDTNIILISKEPGDANPYKAAKAKKDGLKDANNQDYKVFTCWEEHHLVMTDVEKSIKDKIEEKGKKLKEWKVDINRGVGTGLNDAFYISRDKRDELIAQDPNSEDIIKPMLKGDNILRYGIDFIDEYMVCTFPKKKINIDNYPAIRDYLNNYGRDRLEQIGGHGHRKKTEHEWFETQDTIAYWENFEKPKIIYSEIVRGPQFYYDKDEHYYIDATAFIMTGEEIEYLYHILNSKLMGMIFRNLYAGGGLGDEGYRYKKKFIETLPVPPNKDNVVLTEDTVDDYLYNIYNFSEVDRLFIEEEIKTIRPKHVGEEE